MKKFQKIFAAIIAAFCLPPSVFAGETNSVPISQTLPDAGVSLVRVIGSLALVIGLFLAGAWLFKNWRRISMPNSKQPKLNIFETRSLGARQSVFVVGYEKQRFLVAASPAGVNLITHLPDAAEEETAAAEKTSGPMPFAQALAQVLKKK
ncbi:MAG TPA: flagellar biosynthetic protein FliO [Candidatus Sulfotelmatobacter sp.]|jgi:flagellar biogenesis protein FliO|nr:flagellar biosynthetic protein FliO [Candidatus Sulfotelmatobacter sp.]